MIRKRRKYTPEPWKKIDGYKNIKLPGRKSAKSNKEAQAMRKQEICADERD